MRYLRLYIIDGFPSIVISYRPTKKLGYMAKRVYYKLSGATVIRFFAMNHEIFIYNHEGTDIMMVELKGD